MRQVILFNDLILITVEKSKTGHPSGKEFKVKGTIALTHGLEVKALDKPERGLQLTAHGKTTKWQAPTIKDRDAWLADLRTA